MGCIPFVTSRRISWNPKPQVHNRKFLRHLQGQTQAHVLSLYKGQPIYLVNSLVITVPVSEHFGVIIEFTSVTASISSLQTNIKSSVFIFFGSLPFI